MHMSTHRSLHMCKQVTCQTDDTAMFLSCGGEVVPAGEWPPPDLVQQEPCKSLLTKGSTAASMRMFRQMNVHIAKHITIHVCSCTCQHSYILFRTYNNSALALRTATGTCTSSDGAGDKVLTVETRVK